MARRCLTQNTGNSIWCSQGMLALCTDSSVLNKEEFPSSQKFLVSKKAPFHPQRCPKKQTDKSSFLGKFCTVIKLKKRGKATCVIVPFGLKVQWDETCPGPAWLCLQPHKSAPQGTPKPQLIQGTLGEP